MKYFFLLLTLSFTILSLNGCDKKKVSTQPAEIHWDRDMCARCVMVVSDRKNTTQVINPQTGKVYVFDDIGCMVLWFHDKQIPWKDKAVIWITDAKTGEWIDARKAFYDTNNITPMAYGFVAHKSKDDIAKGEEIIDFNEVVKRVKAIGR
ncbi:Nitrous oxide reductase maturation protein, outer-membrane lipoprotein NosL [hydrothermal vent metagenome]|uniref:Nitrous oxide reductase maturation protein, outer-membrane lipoprotein NosL n=1 Tax=hydrothermal vent metagenome TaxID=652676 RepID=A0A1W1CE56_9ZZZZ